MITFTELSNSRHQHFARELFESAFPEEERPPFEVVLNRNQSHFHFFVATQSDDRDPIGILSYWDFGELAYVEHFAIDEDLRGEGLGKAVFLNFLSQCEGQVVCEVELVHDEMSERRVEFYKSMGMISNSQQYFQPSYTGATNPVEMQIMSKYPLDDDDFSALKQLLYEKIYHCDGEVK
ncbi:MAG: GNAT family N-acetyltransferase [Bacteroidales bacterium]|nr:GNAT family N-acetyltransferase [Candidatus Colimorpha onthohippi]